MSATLTRLSSSIFETPDRLYQVTYDAKTTYMACTCPEFGLFGKCLHADEARTLLESETLDGKPKKVTYRRASKIIFISELEAFAESFWKVIGND